MRSAIIALALLGFAAPAFAQSPPAAAQEPAAASGALRLSHQLLSESGVVQSVFGAMGGQLREQARNGLSTAPWATGLPAERRTRLAAYVDRLPDVLMSQIFESMPQIEQRLAASMSALYTPEDVTAIADYFGSPDGVVVLKTVMSAGASQAASGGDNASAMASAINAMTPAQAASLERFAQTQAGRAFARSSNRIGGIVSEALTSVVVAPLINKVRTEMCAIIETTPCPVPG